MRHFTSSAPPLTRLTSSRSARRFGSSEYVPLPIVVEVGAGAAAEVVGGAATVAGSACAVVAVVDVEVVSLRLAHPTVTMIPTARKLIDKRIADIRHPRSARV